MPPRFDSWNANESDGAEPYLPTESGVEYYQFPTEEKGQQDYPWSMNDVTSSSEQQELQAAYLRNEEIEGALMESSWCSGTMQITRDGPDNKAKYDSEVF